tara:strand:- start:185 stop:1207 length:1023 start_codon:yes stop_codon:yes gene_type:complete
MTNNFENFTFGVEIEFIGANRRDVETVMRDAGVNVRMEGYNHTTRNYWKLVTDATLGYENAGELVSPILSGAAGFANLEKTINALNEVPGVTVDRRCGLHVHLAWTGMAPDHVKNIIVRYAKHEDDIDAWMPSSRRGTNSRWAKKIDSTLINRARRGDTLHSIARNVMDRYYKVNAECLRTHGTVEFRQHGGTIDLDKIENWVRFLMGFVTASKKTTSGADANFVPRRKSRAYAAIREQVENAGGTMTYSGKWHITPNGGGIPLGYSIAELNTLYTGAATGKKWNDWEAADWTLIPEKFATFWTRHFPETAVVADTVFSDVDASVANFFTARTAHFAVAA